MYARVRQTDRRTDEQTDRQKQRLLSLPSGGAIIILGSWRPPSVIWCPSTSVCIMNLPALWDYSISTREWFRPPADESTFAQHSTGHHAGLWPAWLSRTDRQRDGQSENINTLSTSYTHSLTSRPSSMRVGDSRRPLLLHCARSCDISFSWMYLQPVHSSMSCIHCLLVIIW